MPTDLYRTYQVLIEETVDPRHPKREKTKKGENYKPDIHHALCVTNELFQDAVAYYTILLVGLAGDEKDGERPLNPLWHEIANDGGKYKSGADTLVRAMAKKYKPLAGCETANGLREKMLFKTRAQGSDDAGGRNPQVAADTYRIIRQQAVTSDDEGGDEAGAKLNEFANNWASILCDPDGETLVPGTGVFDEIHRKLKGMRFKRSHVGSLLEEAFLSADAWLNTTFEANHTSELREKAAKREAAMAKAKTEKAKAKKDAEWTKKSRITKPQRPKAKPSF